MHTKDETILRNTGFIVDEIQNNLKSNVYLIAGCGSIGGSAVELLVRTGARKFILADPDTYDYTNLNRQSAGYSDVGRNKAELMKEKILWANPNCDVEVYTEGLTADNTADILNKTDIVVDGVDVTTVNGWEAKYLLHETSKDKALPVISGYDMDATQYTIFYDYRNEDELIFKGRINKAQVESLNPLDSCLLLIGEKNMPLGIIKELHRFRNQEKDFISQLGISANLFGVIATSIIIQILNGKMVKTEIYLDMWDILDVYSNEDKNKQTIYRDAIKEEITLLSKETL